MLPRCSTRPARPRFALATMAVGVFAFLTVLSPPNAVAQRVLLVPQTFAKIQAAIDASVTQDTILVSPGRYVERIDFKGKGVHVRSTGGAAVTTIDGAAGGSVVVFQSGEPNQAIIEGFTITNGSGSASCFCGGGIYIAGGARPTIRSNRIVNNKADNGVDGYGGGIHCDQGTTPFIVGNLIARNHAKLLGGGVNSWTASLGLVGNVIENNTSSQGGSGIFALGANVVIERNIVRGNITSGSIAHGGGLYFQQGSARVIDNIFQNNQARIGGGLCFIGNVTARIEGNTFLGNTADSGGGIYLQTGQYDIIGNTIQANRAVQPGSGHGGGIANLGGVIRLKSNLITRNTSTLRGGGVFSSAASPDITNNTVAFNTASEGAGLSFAALDANHLPILNTIVWGNIGPQISTLERAPFAAHCDVQGGWPGLNNFSLDPRFVNAAGDDYHLLPSSPCVDRGDSTNVSIPAIDFEGDARRWFGAVDVGADELHPHLYVTGKASPGNTITVKVFGLPGEQVILGVGSGFLPVPATIPGPNWPDLNAGTMMFSTISLLAASVRSPSRP